MKLKRDSFWVKTYSDNHSNYPTNICQLFWYNVLWSIFMFTSLVGIIQSIVWISSKGKNDLYIQGSYAEKLLQVLFFLIYSTDNFLTTNFIILDYIIFFSSLLLFFAVFVGIVVLLDYILEKFKNKMIFLLNKQTNTETKPSIIKAWWRGFKDKYCERIELE